MNKGLLLGILLLPSVLRAQSGSQDTTVLRPVSRFVEFSPKIVAVEVLKGDPFLEVFVSGYATVDCFDIREYHVEKYDTHTSVVPRFRSSKPDELCKSPMVMFREKAADLDPNSPASGRVEVLGEAGWHVQSSFEESQIVKIKSSEEAATDAKP